MVMLHNPPRLHIYGVMVATDAKKNYCMDYELLVSLRYDEGAVQILDWPSKVCPCFSVSLSFNHIPLLHINIKCTIWTHASEILRTNN